MDDNILTAFHGALESPEPLAAMRELVWRELQEQMPREVVLSQLEGLREQLRMEGNEAEEDVVLEVMDFVTGWCSPHMRL